MEFDAPRVVMTQPERPKFTVESDRARVSADRENAYFEGNVRATREADAGGKADGPAGPITLSTEDAVIEAAPLDGFEHQVNTLDSLGTDEPEHVCK